MAKFIVQHNNVDDWVRGEVLDGGDLADRGIDIDRLVRLGAIVPLRHGEDPSGNRFTALSDQENPAQDALGAPLAPGQSFDPTVTRPTSAEIEASQIAGTDADNPDNPGAGTPPQSAFDRMTVANLQEIATQYGIEGAGQMKKADLIAAIEKAQSEP